MVLLTLSDVAALVALPSVQTYIANRPSLFLELTQGGQKGERLNADQNGNQLAKLDGGPIVPLVPVVPSTPAP